MKTRIITCLCVIVMTVVASRYSPSYAESRESELASYRSSSISAVIDEHSYDLNKELTEELQVNLSAGLFKYRILVKYSGVRREIAHFKRQAISWWYKMLSIPDSEDDFKHELLVVEDGLKYWLPMQDIMFESLDKQVNEGKNVVLYVVLIGTIENEIILLTTYAALSK